MTKSKRTYEIPCAWGCGTIIESSRPAPKGGLGCGMGECHTKHNEAAEAHRLEVSRRRSEAQKNRQPRRPQPLYGDFATIAMLNGISTDGTGRKVR